MKTRIDIVKECILLKHKLSKMITEILYDKKTTQSEKAEIYKLIAQDQWE